MRGQAEELARDGYAVLTWSARGFGKSTGQIGLNDPDDEVKDVRRLIDWLAKRPEVRLDAPGDPRVGIAGASYGGAVSLLAAGYDQRVDAIAPQITYWNLADALFPDGVFKKLWAGIFFTTGAAAAQTFEPQLCADVRAGRRRRDSRTPRRAQLLEERSPSAVGDRIKVPTLIVQGQTDSLFPLAQADAMAKAIAAERRARSRWTGSPAATTAATARPAGSRPGSPPGSTATSRTTRAPTPDPPSASPAPAASTPPTARPAARRERRRATRAWRAAAPRGAR